ncbi:MAG: PhzF family phenazine biosynthesis protein [Terricaulis sp.]
MGYAFETVDVFTERRFGGNPLAVFTDARGLSDADMQALAFEFNLSETTFVLPPADPANSARIRIFNRTAEMAFAGHPSIGTAYVLARAGKSYGDRLRLEAPAGVIAVDIEREAGAVVGGKITAPRPLTLGRTFAPELVAPCIGLAPEAVNTRAHPPMLCSVGNPYIIVEIAPADLARGAPDLVAFRAAYDGGADLLERFSLYVYARDGEVVRARMFAPLSGTWEDAATGSAATPLAALLLHLSGGEHIAFDIRQGEHMNRPSLLRAGAHRTEAGIVATVAGRCVSVFKGELQ